MKSIFVLYTLILFLYFGMIMRFLLYPVIAINNFRRKGHNNFCMKLLCAPYVLIDRFLLGGGERYLLYHISLIPSNHLRKYLYKGLGATIGKDVVLHFKTEMRAPERLIIGDGSIIGDNAILDSRQGLIIGKNVNISSNVSIYTLQHDYRDPNFGCNVEGRKLSVEIDDRVWIGSNVIILPGVHVGEGAVCCAGCVVTKNVEPYAVVAGIPARKISERPRVLEYEFSGESCRFY